VIALDCPPGDPHPWPTNYHLHLLRHPNGQTLWTIQPPGCSEPLPCSP
jgi:hypothetical protein